MIRARFDVPDALRGVFPLSLAATRRVVASATRIALESRIGGSSLSSATRRELLRRASGRRRVDLVEIGVGARDDRAMRRLNRRHRGRDSATDVLSFPMLDSSTPLVSDAPALLGDVVVGVETALADARRLGASSASRTSHLLAHGALHLLGWDHDEASRARAMRRLESRILSSLGLDCRLAEDAATATSSGDEMR